jgi:hypothetical protein
MNFCLNFWLKKNVNLFSNLGDKKQFFPIIMTKNSAKSGTLLAGYSKKSFRSMFN